LLPLAVQSVYPPALAISATHARRALLYNLPYPCLCKIAGNLGHTHRFVCAVRPHAHGSASWPPIPQGLNVRADVEGG
jgi:hypothetical protein